MDITCQRCHEILREPDRYCPVCGLPQFTYVASEQSVSSPEEESETGTAATSSAVGGALTGGIAWKPALQSALMVGIPAGVLCSELTPIGAGLSLFWMVTASAWAVSLYRKRTRMRRLSMGSGARIGLVTGMLASWLTLSVNGAYMWIERFLLHQGTQMDAQWLAQVETSLQLNQQMVAQMGVATDQALQFQHSWRALLLSTEGHAGLELWGMVAGALFLTSFAMLGGVMSARFLVPRGEVGARR